MSGVAPAIINPVTGQASDTAAMRYQSLLSSTATQTGFTHSDMAGINSMAASSGLLQGHGGSLGQLGTRIREIAKVTKTLMDISAGI